MDATALLVMGLLSSSVGVTLASTLASFSMPGFHKWTVPTGITSVLFDVYGASGGDVTETNHGL